MSITPAPSQAGERKLVTALFADLVGSTALAESLDPEDWADLVSRVYEAASEAIRRYDGTVTQLSGDAVVAIFGAPVAHEDDAERAVRAAMDLVAAVAELSHDVDADLAVRVGVNTGLAVVGSVGSGDHAEYTALGDAMNVASRMQAAARPGTVLVTQATYQHVRDLIEVVDVGALDVKGKADPVEAFEVAGIRAGVTRLRGVPGLRSPMVGRSADLERLGGLLDAVEAGRGRIALVLGEPGIGKTRLLSEVKASGRLRWFEGRCVSYGRSLPYHLVHDLVASMAGVQGALTVEAVERLAMAADSLPPETVDHLLHLLGLPTPSGVEERLADLDPAAVRRRHVAALGAVVGGMATSSPIALVCEDLHWADGASVDVIGELATVVHRHPILLLATSRPDREADGWRFVSQARADFGDALTEVQLQPLSEDDSRSLVANLLEIESLPGDVRQVILDRTDGNPFFIEEVIRSLIDKDLISRRGDRWVASSALTGLDVPDSIQGLLLGRIDRLPAEARRSARVASVLGRTFTTSLLAPLLDEPVDLAAQLGVLEAHGLVTIGSTAPEIEYAFRHALVQEAAYSGLLRRERQTLHRRVADLLEERHGDRRDEVAALLAHHLDLADEPDRAVPYLLEAGRQARARYAFREARALLARAGDLLTGRTDPAGVRQRIEARVGQVEAGATFVPAGEQLPVLQEILPEAEAAGDERLLARVHVAIAETYRYLGELGRPELHASIERALDLGQRLDDDAFLALPLEVLADLAHEAGRYAEAIAHATRAAEISERRERLAEAGMYFGVAAMASARAGAFGEADDLVTRAQRLAQASGDPNTIGDIDLFRGVIETERGNLDEAVEHTRRGLEQAMALGNTDCQLVGSFNLGDLHLRMGDAAAAIAMLEQSSEIAAYCNAGGMTALSGAWLASARIRAGGGDLEAELRHFEESLGRARAAGMAPGEAEVLRQRATLLAAQPDPDWDAVIADFGSAVEILERLEALPALARTLHEFGMALDLAGRADEAKAALERAEGLFARMAIARSDSSA